MYGAGVMTPTSGGAPVVYASEPAAPVYSSALSGTVTPTSASAPVTIYPALPGCQQPPPALTEPTTLGSNPSVPASCEVPGTTTPNSVASNKPSGIASTGFSSYTPVPVQVGGPTRLSLGQCSTMPRLSVSMPTASSATLPGWGTPSAPGWGTPVKQIEEPKVPPSLTAGLPEPNSIERQKNAYARGLEEQLRHGTDVLAQQLKQQSDYLLAMGDQRKRQYALQVDQEIKQREMELAQQHNEQLLLLQQAAQQQKSALEHQANALLLEYNQKKAQEDLAYQQYQFQKKQYETQLQYNEEMKELQVHQSAAAQQVAHQRAYIAQQAVQAKQQADATARQVRSAHPAEPPARAYPAQGTFSMSLPCGTVPGFDQGLSRSLA
ncbi:unnamed protein product [Durusdinium trenchii]|uniref:Uncharacterized protein n=1 Tax=Durusdinium trenchii TaxID=1381693 RepID=A0ABP0R5U1_9DINO